jgi:phosphatidylinositol alpha-1,6-mannosyltransferase
VYGAAAIAFANSRNTAAMLKSMGLGDDRIVTVYPGVDATRFTPDAPGHLDIRRGFLGESGTLLLSVGRLQRRKGHDLAIQAMARLVSRYDDVHYVIVGDGEERPRLEQLVAVCGVAGRVHLVGEVSASDLPKYFSASDIFLLPNRVENGDIEGFGIVFLEAASSGKPVVAGNSGGVPEAVADGTTGLLVRGTDVDELVDVLSRLIDDTVLRVRLGRSGRQRVMQDFTWQRAADIVGAAHERVARERRS